LLPECRAWEVVSPLDKNGGNITGEGDNVIAAVNGGAVVYASRAGFADTRGSGAIGLTQYLGRRGSGGWGTHSISPVSNPDALQVLFARDEAGVFSEDLSKGIFWGYDLQSVTDDLPHETNLYQIDTSTDALRGVTLATQLEGTEFPLQFINNLGVGASADTEVVTFSARDKLLPEAISGVENLYAWEDGVLRLGGILPDGSVPSEGSYQPPANFLYTYRNAVSADGSMIAFIANKEGQPQLYLRRNHTDTVWVDEAEGTGVATPEDVHLQWMSPNGKSLLFTTSSKLVSGDEHEGRDLYLYTDGPNPEAESNLQLISSEAHPPTAYAESAVVGASDDAGRIYYVSGPNSDLVFWDHGSSKVVTVLNSSYSLEEIVATSSPGSSRVTPDGLHLAFLSGGELTSDVTNGHQEMYVYDATAESLTCASCMSSGPTEADVQVQPHSLDVSPQKEMPQVRPQVLSSDGRLVFFTTTAALVPDDINGVADVYAYDTGTGEQKLVSSGHGENGAWFENASSSGSDIFLVTRNQLVGRDSDSLVDLYDARSEGGFAEPPPPPTPCSGEGCRGALSTGAGVSGPATSSFSGPGNLHKKVKKHHKKHHKKRHHHKRNHGAGK
jgi:Tol biopolymer transport system component